ncbi:MAG: M28 family metallopeptidase [Corallococcus sp.]|nr:M28 family metallopeptidase [Corallococcus sp.]
MKYIEKIAKTNQLERKQAIIDILNEIGVDYVLQSARVGAHNVENIVVSCNPSDKRLVIGAHYDSVDGSTGANDNASGCSVLLHTLERLKNTERSIDFVFFDREEYIDHGSEAYLSIVGKENISAMINLDMCGYNNAIVVSHKGNIDNNAFYAAMNKKILEKHAVTLVGFLPEGDDSRFDECNIPNISVCTLGSKDAEFFIYLGALLKEGKQPTTVDQQRFMSLDIISTMHLATNDNIHSCNQLAIDKVTQWLVDGLIS